MTTGRVLAAKPRSASQTSPDARGALQHPSVGPVDLIWGDAGKNKGAGYGLAKIIQWHPEVLDNLQNHLSRMNPVDGQPTENSIQLESATHRAVIKRN